MNLLQPFTLLSLMLSLLVFQSCESQNADPAYMGNEYYIQTENLWSIFEIDSVVHDDFLGETFHYQYYVKEVQTGFFENSAGEEVMRIERYKRFDDDENWKPTQVWTSRRTASSVIKNEDNVNIVKLRFPVAQNKQWNANAYNIFDPLTYKIESLHQSKDLGILSFDSVLTVLQNEFFTLISDEYKYEVYAHGVGLVYKYERTLKTEIDGSIISGVEYSYTLVEQGIKEKEISRKPNSEL